MSFCDLFLKSYFLLPNRSCSIVKQTKQQQNKKQRQWWGGRAVEPNVTPSSAGSSDNLSYHPITSQMSWEAAAAAFLSMEGVLSQLKVSALEFSEYCFTL